LIAYASSFDQIGTFTNSIEDTEILFELMSGADPFDETTSNAVYAKSTQNAQKIKDELDEIDKELEKLNEEDKKKEEKAEVKKEDVQSSELGLIEVVKKDANFKLLMNKITSKFDTSSQADMLKKLREDQETSSEIKDYISLKLEQNLYKMPARIFENSDKNYKKPNYPGYENANELTSREYTIILAESMINGSFNFDYSKSSPIFINSNNEVEVGQHRVAALYSLGFNLDDPWVQENFKIDRNNK
ncbi:MAG: amidase family protein, partial [bacterium]